MILYLSIQSIGQTLCKNSPWHSVCAYNEVTNDAKELSQEDVQDEWQTVVDCVKVRAEAIQDPAQRRYIEEPNLEINKALSLLVKQN